MEEVIAVISFAEFVPREGSPLYLQLVRYVQRGIAAGTIRPGDELPSRRALAALLGVNPNTIQKACALLEEEGVIASHTGAKSVVTADETVRRRLTEELLEYDASALVRGLRQMGITRAQAVELVERLWDQEERV